MAADTTVVTYRTSDMALASYLKHEGHDAQRVEWENDTCYWFFRDTPHLLKSVDTFAEGKAMIEPREYNRIFGKTKREFYDSEPDTPNRR